MKSKNKIGGVNISGTVKGSDGTPISTFEIITFDGNGNQISDQNFTDGIWNLSPVPGYGYQFTSSSLYGAAQYDGSLLKQDTVIEIPLNAPDGKNYLPLAIGAGLLLLLAAKDNKKKKKVGKITTQEVVPILLIGGAVVVFTLGKSLFEKLGIVDSPDTTALNNAVTNPLSFWNPNFYSQYTSQSVALDTTSAANDVNTILDAFGFFNTCFACIMGVFSGYKTQSQVSFLASVFSSMESGADLLTYLRSGFWPFALSDTEVAQINTFVSKLPTH